MAKSTAQKKSDKKKRGMRSHGGVRNPALHEAGGRAIVTPHPPKPRSSPMAAPRRRLVSLKRIDVAVPWAAKPDLETPSETLVLRAVLSNGETIERAATVTYRKGEREKIIEAMMSGQSAPAEEALHTMRGVIDRRASAVGDAYAYLQRMYGKPQSA